MTNPSPQPLLNDKINSFAQVEMLVIQWAEARKIIPNATPQAQLNKALEELAELFKAESQGRLPDIKDGVGDVVVCLINYCALKDIDLTRCLIGAYNEIKDRKGTLMKDGTFVKESPIFGEARDTAKIAPSLQLERGVSEKTLDAAEDEWSRADVSVEETAHISFEETKAQRVDPETGFTESVPYALLTDQEKLDHDARAMAHGLPTLAAGGQF